MAIRRSEPQILLVTGASGSGKTTYCLRIIKKYRQEGRRVSGLLSPGLFENGVKTAIQAMDLCTGEIHLFATKELSQDECVQVGEWLVRVETINWGNQVLSRSDPCELLVIDELGPLEFILGGGWQSAFTRLEQKDFMSALVVVRPELRKLAYQRIRVTGEIDVCTASNTFLPVLV